MDIKHKLIKDTNVLTLVVTADTPTVATDLLAKLNGNAIGEVLIVPLGAEAGTLTIKHLAADGTTLVNYDANRISAKDANGNITSGNNPVAFAATADLTNATSIQLWHPEYALQFTSTVDVTLAIFYIKLDTGK